MHTTGTLRNKKDIIRKRKAKEIEKTRVKNVKTDRNSETLHERYVFYHSWNYFRYKIRANQKVGYILPRDFELFVMLAKEYPIFGFSLETHTLPLKPVFMSGYVFPISAIHLPYLNRIHIRGDTMSITMESPPESKKEMVLELSRLMKMPPLLDLFLAIEHPQKGHGSDIPLLGPSFVQNYLFDLNVFRVVSEFL
jgi:hypothetical protein